MGAFAWLFLTFLPKIEPFFTAVENFIVAHWKGVLIVLMASFIFYQNFSNTRFLFDIQTIPHLNAQLATDEAQIKTLKSDLDIAAKANAGLTTTIQNQNATINQEAVISAQLQKKNAALATQLATERVANKKKVSDILNGQVPQSCEASVQYLRQMESKLSW